MLHGAAFPSIPIERELFYRDDLHSWYIYNGTTWISLTVGGANYIDLPEIVPPANPPADTLRLYAEDFHGFTFFSFRDVTGMVRKLVRDSVFVGLNVTGAPIPSARAVYATGNVGGVPTIALARANAVATMPAIGITVEAIADGAYGRIMQVGLLENVNTSAFATGNVLYVSAAVPGAPTNVPPVYPNIRQEMGTVLASDAVIGSVQCVARSMFYEGLIDHGGLLGLGDDDHPQYIRHALATAIFDFLVASGPGVFIKATLAQVKVILDWVADIAAAIAAHSGLTTGVHGVGADTVAAVGDIAVDANLSVAAQDAITKRHTQGTDTALGAVATKNPPIDADKALYRDSAAGDALVTSTWTQIKAFLKTYFDTLYGAIGLAHTRLHSITSALDHSSAATAGKMLKADANGLPIEATNTDADVADAVTKKHTQGTDVALGVVGTKNSPIDADKALYRDSAAGDALVTSTWTQIKAFLKTYWDGLYEALGAVAAHAGLTTGVHGVTGTVVGTSDNQILTTKTLIATSNTVEEITTTTSSATPAPTGGSLRNFFSVTALAEAATFAAPSGTPANSNKLIIRIKDNGTARALSWNAIYRAVGVTLPTTTVLSKTTYMALIYNSAASKWDCLAVNTEA